MYESLLTEYFKDTTSIALPNTNKEPIIQIDSGLRTVILPPVLQTVGVTMDNRAERYFFQVDRYFDGYDFSKEQIIVRYINAGNIFGVYEVTDVDVSEDAILFGWEIDNNVTQFSGTVLFQIQIGVTSQYQWSTVPCQFKVLGGLVIDESIDHDWKQNSILDNLALELQRLEVRVGKLEDGYFPGTTYEFVGGVNGFRAIGSDGTTQEIKIVPSVSKADIGLDKVGNYKAVSTVANQNLTQQEQLNAQGNIGYVYDIATSKEVRDLFNN